MAVKKMHRIPPFISTVAVPALTTGVSGAAAETTNQPAPLTLHLADTGNNRD